MHTKDQVSDRIFIWKDYTSKYSKRKDFKNSTVAWYSDIIAVWPSTRIIISLATTKPKLLLLQLKFEVFESDFSDDLFFLLKIKTYLKNNTYLLNNLRLIL